MNTDTLQLIGQILLIGLGPILAKRGISIGSADVDHVVGGFATVAGIIWKFWHWNATPSATTPQPVNVVKLTPLLVLTAGLMGFITACAPLQPGADPIVVRCEQTETTAKGGFDAILNIDNSNRAFFRTNAPGLHNFCEWLRTPQTIEGTNTLPRCSAMLASLDDVKLAYKAGRATSNEVFAVLFPVENAASQASAWMTATTNQPAQ